MINYFLNQIFGRKPASHEGTTYASLLSEPAPKGKSKIDNQLLADWKTSSNSWKSSVSSIEDATVMGLDQDAEAYPLMLVRYRTERGDEDLHLIKARFPWAYRFEIDPNTVHTSYVFYALTEIANIVDGDEAAFDQILHLRLVTNYQKQSQAATGPDSARIYLSMVFTLASESIFKEAFYELSQNIKSNSSMPKRGLNINSFKSIFRSFNEAEAQDLIDDGPDTISSKDSTDRSSGIDLSAAFGDNSLSDIGLDPKAQSTDQDLDLGRKMVVIAFDAPLKIKQLATDSCKDDQKRLEALAKRLELQPLSKPLCDFEIENFHHENFPNFSELTTFIEDQSSLSAMGDKTFFLPPILLLGDPGIGKTEYIYQLSQALKTSFLKIDMGSAQSGSSLSGSDIYWGNSRHGQFFELLAFGDTANPIVFLDEIDKVDATGRHSPVGALYSLLEKTSAKKFADLALPGVNLDASSVIWVAAANDLRSIDPAILSRFRVFNVPVPNREQMPTIVQSVYTRMLANERWGPYFEKSLSLDVIRCFDGISPRGVRQVLEAAVALAARSRRTEIIPSDIQSFATKTRMGF